MRNPKGFATYGHTRFGWNHRSPSFLKRVEHGEKSNGDCVVAIVHSGQVKTVYLEEATQTFDLSVSRTDVLVEGENSLEESNEEG